MTRLLAHSHPVETYLSNLSAGSRPGTRQALDLIAAFLSGNEHDRRSFPWHEVRYQHTVAVRAHLVEKYQPSTVNRMLASLRGVLKETWRLGQMDAETYRRAIDVPNVRGSVLPRGRALESDELGALFRTCTNDPTAMGRRDAAMLAVFYGTGMRRAELAGLDVNDLDPEDGSIRILHAKRNKERTVYLSADVVALLEAWLDTRGREAGPAFNPIRQNGEIPVTRLRGESIGYILRSRQKQAGIASMSPHDLRRSFVTSLLDAGVDLFTVQNLAGHADAVSTARYDRRGESAKRRAVAALPLPSLVWSSAE